MKSVQAVVIGKSLVDGATRIFVTTIPGLTEDMVSRGVHLDLAKVDAQAGGIIPEYAFDYDMLLKAGHLINNLD